MSSFAPITLPLLVTGNKDPPFWAEDDAGVLELTLKGKYKFFSPDWDTVTATAKDFISRLVVIDPAKRITSEQALAHPWIAGVGDDVAPKRVLTTVSENLVKNFNAKKKFRVSVQIGRTEAASSGGRLMEKLGRIAAGEGASAIMTVMTAKAMENAMTASRKESEQMS
ncbi:Calcium/calmodulin-dependent protein kinase type 1D [Gonapodya sp. JEL0774]|nr:Calcium/calmodulin-dependent protein kinase type 1D [Gonapodya sp. JEL0774]